MQARRQVCGKEERARQRVREAEGDLWALVAAQGAAAMAVGHTQKGG